MASSDTEPPEFSELSSIFQRLLMRRDLSLFLPFILGLTTESENNNRTPEEPGQETSQRIENQQERIILINPFTQGMVVIEGADSLESLFRDLASKNGHPPASKASIQAMPNVEIGESEDSRDGECVVCLEEWEVGGVVKEMPCKHRFHTNCIEKWLRIHGSCPVCRYKMPVDEEEFGKKREERERRLGREIWVSFSFNGSRRNSDSNQNPATDFNDDSSSSLEDDRQMEEISQLLRTVHQAILIISPQEESDGRRPCYSVKQLNHLSAFLQVLFLC